MRRSGKPIIPRPIVRQPGSTPGESDVNKAIYVNPKSARAFDAVDDEATKVDLKHVFDQRKLVTIIYVNDLGKPCLLIEPVPTQETP